MPFIINNANIERVSIAGNPIITAGTDYANIQIDSNNITLIKKIEKMNAKAGDVFPRASDQCNLLVNATTRIIITFGGATVVGVMNDAGTIADRTSGGSISPKFNPMRCGMLNNLIYMSLVEIGDNYIVLMPEVTQASHTMAGGSRNVNGTTNRRVLLGFFGLMLSNRPTSIKVDIANFGSFGSSNQNTIAERSFLQSEGIKDVAFVGRNRELPSDVFMVYDLRVWGSPSATTTNNVAVNNSFTVT